MENQNSNNYERELKRPIDNGITDKQIIIAYRLLTEELREELKTMPAYEALEIYKNLLMRLV